MSILRFRRPFQLTQISRSWLLYVDGEFVANIGNGSSVEVPVSPGAHEILARTMIMYSSRVLPVEVRGGETLDVEVGSNWRLFGPIYLFARSDYLYLRVGSSQPDRRHTEKQPLGAFVPTKRDQFGRTWGRGWLVGLLIIGLLGVVCLGGCGLLFSWLFSMTSDAVQAADQFLSLLAEGKVNDAYNSTASRLRAEETAEAFADSVRQVGLTDYASSSWHSRDLHNEVVTLKGTITTRTGGTLPVTIVLIKESGGWRVQSVTTPGRQPK